MEQHYCLILLSMLIVLKVSYCMFAKTFVIVAEIFPLEGVIVFIGFLNLKVHLNWAANRTWSAFVPFCTQRFNGDIYCDVVTVDSYSQLQARLRSVADGKRVCVLSNSCSCHVRPRVGSGAVE